MKKLLTTMFLIGAMALPAVAQEWIDVTDAYIQNPRLDSNYSGWTFDVPGSTGAKWQNASYTNGSVSINKFIQAFCEVGWEETRLGSGTILQKSMLSKGKYKLNFDAIAVFQGSGWGWWGSPAAPANNAYLYAKDADGKVSKTKISTNNNAPKNFTLTFELATDGIVEMGILLDNTDANWVAADNFKLEWYGVFTHVSSLELSEKELTLIPAEEQYLTTIVTPDNATYRNAKWSTSDQTIATVDATGKVKGVGYGTCTITAESTDNPEIKATCTVTVEKSSILADKLIINEIQSSNIDMFMDPSFNYGGWIELYNPNKGGVELAGLYITDDENNLTKFRLPETIGIVNGNGYKVLWFDHNGIWNLGEHNQIDFKLDYDGGEIIISDGKSILLRQSYPEGYGRTAYARKADGGEEWGVTDTPTPGASNSNSSFATEMLPYPVIDKDSQIFSGTLQICVNIPSGATLRYTTDGSTPTATNGTVSRTGILSTKATTAYRFRLFKEGMLPSPVATRTYIYNDKNFDMPIISIVSDNSNLYSSDYGVFVKGSKNGRPGGEDKNNNSNWNMDWDRPVNFEYIGPDNGNDEYQMLINQEVDLSRCGGWSRAWTPYSFKLKAAKYYYGMNTLDYQFFPDKPYLKHKTLQIRNGGNDFGCRIKDAALQEIISRSGLYVDTQEWVPVLHYINGKFMGVINMREPNNKHFAYANYGIDTDEMDQFEISPDSGYVQMEGTKDAFNELYELAKNAADEDTYREIEKRIDIDEYINYMAIELYLGGDDWPKNNVKGFRDVNDGKFHFVIFDLDHAFNQSGTAFTGFKAKQKYTFDPLCGKTWDGKSLSGKRITAEIEFVTIFLNLIKNKEFKKKFEDHFCVIAGSVFTPDRCKDIVNEMANHMAPSMSISNGYDSGRSPWDTANKVISNLSQSRIGTMVSAMATFVGEKNTRLTTKVSSNIGTASLLVNDFEIPTGKFNGYMYSPFVLKAQPKPGYEFLGWTKTASDDLDAITYLTTDAEYEAPTTGYVTAIAIYKPITDEEMLAAGTKPIMVNEVSAANSMYVNDYFKKNDWIELYNTTDKDIDIAGMYISDKEDKPQKYQIPVDDVNINTIVPAHGYKVIWADKLENKGKDIHASFKLEAEGGNVLISKYAGDNIDYADTLTYSAHLGTQSFGRFPDGTAETFVMNAPTIGKSNLVISGDSLFSANPDADPSSLQQHYIKEGGMTIAYVDGAVNVKSEDSDIAAVSIFTASGTKQASAPLVRQTPQFVSINVSLLPKGIYIARAVTKDGDECHIKFIIR